MQFAHLETRYVNYSNKDELEVYVKQGLSLEIDPNHLRRIMAFSSPLRQGRDFFLKNKEKRC
jgi:hypothetical protein